jgi:FAD/FMN-containing dehydrogenase
LERKTTSNEISRRNFLKLTASTGVALSIGASDYAYAGVFQERRAVGTINENRLRDFVSGVHGSVVRPTDQTYEAARRVWNAKFDRRPGLIVRCADPSDVKRAIDFARAEELLVAVRSGGHSWAGYSTCDGGVVIDLSGMKQFDIDRRKLVVRAQPGLLGTELDVATQRVGLAMVLGGCGSVGIGGFTLGGGEGDLNGKFGLGCDNLLSADVVLADGRMLTASAHENADLFWALRGGGGNFGIVTSFLFRAYPLTNVLAGQLIYDIAQSRGVLRAYREYAPSAPDALTAGLTFTRLKDGPALLLHAVYAGDETSAAPVLRSLRKLAKPKADTIAPISYLAFKTASAGPPPGFPSTVRTAFLPTLRDEVIDAITEVGARIPPAAEIEMFHLHGAVSRVPLPDTAFPLRQPGFDCFAAAAWLEPAQRDGVERWVESFWEAVRSYVRRAYTNMLNDEESDRVKDAYGRQYARLAMLKRRFDPHNFFRLNPNIKP